MHRISIEDIFKMDHPGKTSSKIFLGLIACGLILRVLYYLLIAIWWTIKLPLIIGGAMMLLYLAFKIIDEIELLLTHFVDWVGKMPCAVRESFDAWTTRSAKVMVKSEIERIQRRNVRWMRIERAVSALFSGERGMFARN